ncbi:MAG: hypothetical protein NY202_04155 [Mollicutes bacterium UO1]
MVGKKWLESKEKEPPRPTTENFAPPKVDTFSEIPKNSKPVFIDQNPVIPNKKPIHQDNSPLLAEISEKPIITNCQPQPVISEIPFQTPRIIKSQKEPQSQKKNILLAKIRNLETENSNLKAVIQSEKQNNQFLQEINANLTDKTTPT